jgi:major tropism determinant Mtd-like protein
MSTLNRSTFQFRFRRGLKANILLTTTYGQQGEPGYTTDDKHLWLNDGAVFQIVPTLDLAVVADGDVVTSGGEIVWLS